MFANLTYFERIVIACILGGFLGTLLSWIVNTVYKLKVERQKFTRRILQESILVTLLLSVVVGCIAWGFDLFDLTWDITSEEADSIQYSFTGLFLSTFFSGSLDTLLGLAKLARKAFFIANGER